MIYVIATVNVREDKRDPFIQGARAVVAATRQEEGCLAYELHQSVTEPNRFVFVERWTSREALGGHFRAPHLQTWWGISSQCISQPTVVEIISPAEVEKL